MRINYMGCRIKLREDGMHINKENLVMGKDGSAHIDSVFNRKKCEVRAQKNLESNMKYFNGLSHDNFEEELKEYLNKFKKFKEYKNLNALDGLPGYYIMVLDSYCQVYIGTTNNIKRRILGHWSKQMDIDRLVFGSTENSILSINSFRAYDTTRVFAKIDEDTYTHENKYISNFNNKYLLNRTAGDLHSLQDSIHSAKMREEHKTSLYRKIINFIINK